MIWMYLLIIRSKNFKHSWLHLTKSTQNLSTMIKKKLNVFCLLRKCSKKKKGFNSFLYFLAQMSMFPSRLEQLLRSDSSSIFLSTTYHMKFFVIYYRFPLATCCCGNTTFFFENIFSGLMNIFNVELIRSETIACLSDASFVFTHCKWFLARDIFYKHKTTAYVFSK